MDSKLEAYLLSKSSITIGSEKLVKTFGNCVKKSTSKQDPTPHKSGEIYRTVNGKFSFSCTLCDAVCGNCSDIVDHINSHFRKQTCNALKDIEVTELPSIPVPEFVSIGELKPEADVIETVVTTNGIPKKLANVKLQPKRTDGTSISKTSFEMPDQFDCKIKPTSDESDSAPTTRIVRIIRRKRSEIKRSAAERLIKTPTKRSDIKHSADEESSLLPTIKIVKGRSEIRHIANEDSNSAPTTRIVKIIKRKRSETKRSVDVDEEANSVPPTTVAQQKCSGIQDTANEDSVSAPTTKIVKIVKLKRIKLRPGNKTHTGENRLLSNAAQKNDFEIPEDFEKETLSPELRPIPAVDDTESKEPVTNKVLNIIETERPVYVRPKNRSCCYQCEMEPRIYELSDPRRHICLFCPIWFPNHIDFENHVQTNHNKDPNYVVCKDFHCYVCEKSFDFREYLTRHLKVHKETADHLCATCGSSFKTKSRLTAHMKKHEDQTFECDQCSKKFKQFVRLRKHLWCHNTNLSFVCEICSKAFKMKRYLNLHMAVHDEAKINCRHCDATFHFKSVRRAHEKSRHNVV